LLDAGVTVIAGEVEGRWEGILADALQGKLPRIYNFLGSPPELDDAPPPFVSRQYLRHFLAANVGTIDASRGCPFNCSFCTIVNVHGHRMRCRDVNALITAVRDNYRRYRVAFYFFTDDNFARNSRWEEIFDGLIRLREEERIPVQFMIQADVLSYRKKHFVHKARKAGCSQVFVGVESLNPDNLAAAGKRQNDVRDLSNLVNAFHEAGIMVHAAYIIGFPCDTPASIRRDVDRLARELQVRQASFFMLTPLPGSRDHRQAVVQRMPLDPDLNRYDAFHATFHHSRMTDREWEAAYQNAWRSFYGLDNMRNLLNTTPADRYWNVFKNLLWAKSSVFIEHQHPMIAGLLRRKRRRLRRPGLTIESWFSYQRRRWSERLEKARQWMLLLFEMEELWLGTRRQSERERILWEEIVRIRHDASEWRQLRTRQLQVAYRRALARLAQHSSAAKGSFRIPSRFTLFLKRANLFSHRVLKSRESLRQFWSQMARELRRGRVHRLQPIRMIVHLVREVVLAYHFTAALLSTGIR
jgi:radical SAM superfamily enzyme YgiQ (UPF0313 family)